MAKLPPAKKAPAPGRNRTLGIVAIAAAVVLALLMGFLIYSAMQRRNAPLPAGPATNVPVPQALPEVNQPNLPQAALPETQVPAAPQVPVTQVTPPPVEKEPDPSGTITWWWQLYQVTPSFISMYLGNPLPGHVFVALGVTVQNQSTVDVEVSNDRDEFSLNVDNRLYRADVLRTADAIFFNNVPYLVKTTLRPGGRANGFTVYPIPVRYSQVTVEWHPNVPRTVQVVRVDPKTPLITGPQPASNVPVKSPLDEE